MDTGRTRRFKEKMELHIIILRKRRGFKAFALTGRRGITNIKPRANALGYELLPFQGVRRLKTKQKLLTYLLHSINLCLDYIKR